MTDRVHLSLVDSCIQPQACYQQDWYQGCPLAYNYNDINQILLPAKTSDDNGHYPCPEK